MANAGPKIPQGDLKTYCWCMGSIVNVSADRVRQGLTESCGQKGCNHKHPVMRKA